MPARYIGETESSQAVWQSQVPMVILLSAVYFLSVSIWIILGVAERRLPMPLMSRVHVSPGSWRIAVG